MQSSSLVQPAIGDVSLGEPVQEQERVNKHLLKAIDEIYSPVLKLMKLFGIYFGDTSFKHLVHASGSSRKRSNPARIICVLVVAGFWLNVVMGIVNIFFGDSIYIYIMISLWCGLIALNGTLCLVTLNAPLADTRQSRFGHFLRNLSSVKTNVSLEKVKSKSTKGIIAFGLFYISGVAGSLLTNLMLGINMTSNKPWDQWFGFKIVSPVFLIIGCGVWLLPILFYCITCWILEALFDDLQKRISPLHSISVDLAALKMEHHKLCEVVEFADKMLGIPVFGMVSLYLPLICFTFYQVFNLPPENKTVFLIINLLFFLVSASMLAIIMVFGSMVNEKVNECIHYRFNKLLLTIIICLYYVTTGYHHFCKSLICIISLGP